MLWSPASDTATRRNHVRGRLSDEVGTYVIPVMVGDYDRRRACRFRKAIRASHSGATVGAELSLVGAVTEETNHREAPLGKVDSSTGTIARKAADRTA